MLISKEEGYTILTKRLDDGKLEHYVVIPIKDFKNNNYGG